ncbi:MAG: hypothetical protein HY828_05695 [Actinobacteria bacterium]|nr:hypothetical protein [Actinomycetota bacterium]
MSRHRILPALGVVLAACGGGGTADLSTIPTTVLPSSVASTAAPTTVADSPSSTVAVTTAPGTIGLSADGPWRQVDSAPGITTPGLVYELMPKLWVYLPITEDVPNGITWTFNETDRPLIEAYLQARLVYFAAVTTSPMDLDNPGWQEWYADGGAVYRPGLEARDREGQVADLDVGVVLRPQVIGDERTETDGIVFDCVLDGGVFRMPDGSLAEGSTIGVVADGVGYRMASVQGTWKVTGVGTQPEACL